MSASNRQPAGEVFSVFSWNVRYFSHPVRGVTSTRRGLERAAAALAALDPPPEVIVLQEIENRSLRSHRSRLLRRSGADEPQIEELSRAMDAFARRHGGPTYDALYFEAHGHDRRLALYSTGLAILVRSDLAIVAHNADAPRDITHRRIARLARYKQRRICAHARVRTPGGTCVDVFNTHLSLPAFFARAHGPTGGRFGEAPNQMREAEALVQFLCATSDLRHAILAGDFNARPGSHVYRYILRATPLRDAIAEALALGHREINGLPTAGFGRRRFRLDHVFVGRGLAVECALFAGGYGRRNPFWGLSDHVPLWVRFRVRD